MSSELHQPPAASRPLPRLVGLTADFYGFLAQHELRFQRCLNCGKWRHLPRELCPSCWSDRYEWALSSRRGTVFTWTTTERALHPAFTDTPFAQVIVELEEGPRVMTQVKFPVGKLEHGLPVVMEFEEIAPGLVGAVARKA